MSGDAFVGLDLGTSSLKGVVVAADGSVLASAQAAYPTSRPVVGAAEQDPEDWLRATGDVVAALAAEVGTDRWAAIGLAGMIPTLALVDDEGAAVGPALTWEDARAEEDGTAYRDAAGPDELYRRTGQWVDGRYLLPMVLRLAREEPEHVKRARQILSAKDLLFSALTGEKATDPSTATGFGCFDLRSGAWAEDLAGDLVDRLPPVRVSTWAVGATGAFGVPPNAPVVLGSADSVAGAVALRATAPATAAALWGTSTAIVGVAADPVVDPAHRFLVTPLALGEGWGLEMDLVSTGSAIMWAALMLGSADAEEVVRLAATAPMGANGVRFLPFLGHGEQGALWDPGLRGAIAGLTLAHDRADVARALVEGIVLEFRRCISVLEGSGVTPPSIAVAGDAVAGDVIPQMLADATGIPIERFEGPVSAIGAAAIAAAAIGVDLGARPPAGRLDPATTAGTTWDDAMERHDRLLAAIRRSG